MDTIIEPTLSMLSRTPGLLRGLVEGLPQELLRESETPQSCSAMDVAAHLLHSDLVNWGPRLNTLMAHGSARPFEVFDRFGHFELSRGKAVEQLLAEFDRARDANLDSLRSLHLSREDLDRKGLHPEFGEVTLAQLLASWVVHDLNHLRQIIEVLARQRTGQVGPWRAFLAILDG
jgi:hypothetical protein